MDMLFDYLEGSMGDGRATLVFAAAIFLATALVAFGAMAFLQTRGAFKRRAAGMAMESPAVRP